MAAVFGVLAVGAAVLAPETVDRAVNDAFGFETRVAVAAPKAGADARSGQKAANYLSSAEQRAASGAPAGTYGTRQGRSHYKLLTDVTWSSCDPIRVRYNATGAPVGAAADLKVAVRKVSDATGLRITTAPTSIDGDGGYRYDSGADAWGTVLVTWGQPGDGILNRGASASATPHAAADGREAVYASGQVTINAGHDRLYARGFGTPGSRVALYMHELGHVMGLDHTGDRRQLMYPTVAAARDFGAGDLAGLRQLASGPCS